MKFNNSNRSRKLYMGSWLVIVESYIVYVLLLYVKLLPFVKIYDSYIKNGGKFTEVVRAFKRKNKIEARLVK